MKSIKEFFAGTKKAEAAKLDEETVKKNPMNLEAGVQTVKDAMKKKKDILKEMGE